VVLTAHWLVSDYCLRAWRALTCLLAAVLVATVGLRRSASPTTATRGAPPSLPAGAGTHVVNPPEGLLTEPGQAIRIAIGLLGPVLLGFALLVLRGRVKR